MFILYAINHSPYRQVTSHSFTLLGHVSILYEVADTLVTLCKQQLWNNSQSISVKIWQCGCSNLSRCHTQPIFWSLSHSILMIQCRYIYITFSVLILIHHPYRFFYNINKNCECIKMINLVVAANGWHEIKVLPTIMIYILPVIKPIAVISSCIHTYCK